MFFGKIRKIIKLERTYQFHTFDELIEKTKKKISDLSISKINILNKHFSRTLSSKMGHTPINTISKLSFKFLNKNSL